MAENSGGLDLAFAAGFSDKAYDPKAFQQND